MPDTWITLEVLAPIGTEADADARDAVERGEIRR